MGFAMWTPSDRIFSILAGPKDVATVVPGNAPLTFLILHKDLKSI